MEQRFHQVGRMQRQGASKQHRFLAILIRLHHHLPRHTKLSNHLLQYRLGMHLPPPIKAKCALYPAHVSKRRADAEQECALNKPLHVRSTPERLKFVGELTKTLFAFCLRRATDDSGDSWCPESSSVRSFGSRNDTKAKISKDTFVDHAGALRAQTASKAAM